MLASVTNILYITQNVQFNGNGQCLRAVDPEISDHHDLGSGYSNPSLTPTDNM